MDSYSYARNCAIETHKETLSHFLRVWTERFENLENNKGWQEIIPENDYIKCFEIGKIVDNEGTFLMFRTVFVAGEPDKRVYNATDYALKKVFTVICKTSSKIMAAKHGILLNFDELSEN